MRLSTAVALLVISLSSAAKGTSAFGSCSSYGVVSQPFRLCENRHISSSSNMAFCRGGGVSLKASVVDGAVVAANLDLLSERGRSAIQDLVEHDDGEGSQRHVYADWPEPGTDDDGKRQLAEQVRVCNADSCV
jgi:hypothetical protein